MDCCARPHALGRDTPDVRTAVNDDIAFSCGNEQIKLVEIDVTSPA